jgi:hypothetical protein
LSWLGLLVDEEGVVTNGIRGRGRWLGRDDVLDLNANALGKVNTLANPPCCVSASDWIWVWILRT